MTFEDPPQHVFVELIGSSCHITMLGAFRPSINRIEQAVNGARSNGGLVSWSWQSSSTIETSLVLRVTNVRLDGGRMT
jgi:hypothetical protein